MGDTAETNPNGDTKSKDEEATETKVADGEPTHEANGKPQSDELEKVKSDEDKNEKQGANEKEEGEDGFETPDEGTAGEEIGEVLEEEEGEVEGEHEEEEDHQEDEEATEKKQELDEDEIVESPAYIPKSGRYYMHDSRMTDEVEAVEEKKRSRADGQWNHDRFDENWQKPRSRKQLIDRYGYDIRLGETKEDTETVVQAVEDEDYSPRPSAPRSRGSRGGRGRGEVTSRGNRAEMGERPVISVDNGIEDEERPAERRAPPRQRGRGGETGRSRGGRGGERAWGSERGRWGERGKGSEGADNGGERGWGSERGRWGERGKGAEGADNGRERGWGAERGRWGGRGKGPEGADSRRDNEYGQQQHPRQFSRTVTYSRSQQGRKGPAPSPQQQPGPKRYSAQRGDNPSSLLSSPPPLVPPTSAQFVPRTSTDVVYFDPTQQPPNRLPPREKKIMQIIPPTQ